MPTTLADTVIAGVLVWDTRVLTWVNAQNEDGDGEDEEGTNNKASSGTNKWSKATKKQMAKRNTGNGTKSSDDGVGICTVTSSSKSGG